MIYILFQTDVHRTRASRVFCGVFSSEVRAVDAAKANGLYTCDAEVEIIEVEINQFGEV
ncbi:MAG: hypothetical protein LBS55_03220 [Prevotellaceae bacterium]|nr:hypothetical protein [Prevotellaceae bacterium]